MHFDGALPKGEGIVLSFILALAGNIISHDKKIAIDLIFPCVITVVSVISIIFYPYDLLSYDPFWVRTVISLSL